VAWRKFRRSNKHPSVAEWVAAQVNRQFPHWPHIRSKWIAQNKKEILWRVDGQDDNPGSAGSCRQPA
jgi:hypothetical protein